MRGSNHRLSSSPANSGIDCQRRARDAVINGTGRDLVVLKASMVDAELEKLDLKLRTVRCATRMVSLTAYEVGETAGGGEIGVPKRSSSLSSALQIAVGPSSRRTFPLVACAGHP